jgi:hypothetical protein
VHEYLDSKARKGDFDTLSEREFLKYAERYSQKVKGPGTDLRLPGTTIRHSNAGRAVICAGCIQLQKEAAMPIIDLSVAQAVNQTVRDRYSKGYKSSNKVYYDGPIEEDYDYIDLDTLTRGDRALQARLEVSEPRLRVLRLYQQRGRRVVTAERMLERYKNAMTATVIRSNSKEAAAQAALARIRGVEPAGNCGEMARSAATQVRNFWLARQSTYIGKLESPGDHEFCIVAENPQRLKNLSLLTNGKYSEWVVIDPWLNVCCTANNYLSEVGRQLKKWAGAGKHILWNKRFYRPTGSYKENFEKMSGVRFTKF